LDDQSDATAEPGNDRTRPAQHASPGSYTVLIVDDEDSVRNFAERVLRDAGYRTALAMDGTDALKVAAGLGPFQILVTDFIMPGITGDELARRLRLMTPKLKTLYLTGFSGRLMEQKGTLWEGEAFLDKPCSVAGLLEAVSLLLFDGCTPPPDAA
jgi:CheY-like chemotaxis protein